MSFPSWNFSSIYSTNWARSYLAITSFSLLLFWSNSFICVKFFRTFSWELFIDSLSFNNKLYYIESSSLTAWFKNMSKAGLTHPSLLLLLKVLRFDNETLLDLFSFCSMCFNRFSKICFSYFCSSNSKFFLCNS